MFLNWQLNLKSPLFSIIAKRPQLYTMPYWKWNIPNTLHPSRQTTKWLVVFPIKQSSLAKPDSWTWNIIGYTIASHNNNSLYIYDLVSIMIPTTFPSIAYRPTINTYIRAMFLILLSPSNGTKRGFIVYMPTSPDTKISLDIQWLTFIVSSHTSAS